MAKNTSYEPGSVVDQDFIPLCVPNVMGNEWKYIKGCLDSSWVSSVGPFVDRFEKEFAEKVDLPFTVAATNGTSALHLSLLALGIEADTEIITSTLTFIAPINTIKYIGAHPVLIDADIDTWQMDPKRVEEFLDSQCKQNGNGTLINKKTGRRVSAIMPVHILGGAVDMDSIVSLAKKYNLPIIEDATEALGTRYKGKQIGAFGDVSCFSFNGNKMITTGGGGMIATAQENLAKQCKYLSTQAKDDPLEYIHNTVGYNYRLSNIQAAMGIAQLENLDNYIDVKHRIAKRYETALGNIPGITPMPTGENVDNSYWMYTILIDESKTGIGSRQLLKTLLEARIQTRPLWQPMHLSPVCAGDYRVGGENAEKLNQMALSIPCSSSLKEDEQKKVIEVIRNSVNK